MPKRVMMKDGSAGALVSDNLNMEDPTLKTPQNDLLCDDKENKRPAKRQLRMREDAAIMDKGDVHQRLDYGYHIYSFQKEQESRMSFAQYRGSCPGFDKMRMVLVDWAVGVHDCLGFSSESLFLGMSVLDRYCTQDNTVGKRDFQLYGIASFMIATKYVEEEPLTLAQCVFFTARVYSPKQILEAEAKILAAIGFRLAVPTVASFTQHFLGMYDCDDDGGDGDGGGGGDDARDVALVARYVTERGLYSMALLAFPPSLAAAAAVLLALGAAADAPPARRARARAHLAAAAGWPRAALARCLRALRRELAAQEAYRTPRTRRPLAAVDGKFPPGVKQLLGELLRECAGFMAAGGEDPAPAPRGAAGRQDQASSADKPALVEPGWALLPDDAPVSNPWRPRHDDDLDSGEEDLEDEGVPRIGGAKVPRRL